MPVDVNDVMQLLSTLSKEKNLRVTVKESVRGGVIAGVTTAMGGIVMGPPGLAIGGALGGGLAYYLSKGNFRPVGEIIMEMNDADKQILYNDAMRILNKMDVTDAVLLLSLVQSDPVVYGQVFHVLTNFFNTHLKMEILD